MYSLKKVENINVRDFLSNKRVLLYLGILMLMLSFSFVFFLLVHDFVVKLVMLSHRMFVKAEGVFRGVTYIVGIIGLVFVLLSFSKDVY